MKIYIVGLGAREGGVTLAGYKLIADAEKNGRSLVFKTALADAAKGLLEFPHDTLDGLYDSAADFDALNESIAADILRRAKSRDAVFCVTGSGVNDGSVALLRKKTNALEFFPAADGTVDALSAFPSPDYSVCSAYGFLPKTSADTGSPLILTEIADKELAGTLKLALMRFYGEEQEAVFFADGKPKKIKLFELDRQKRYDHTSCAVIPGRTLTEKTRFSFDDLLALMARLIAPDGCEWDKAQTHESIRSNAVEEAYEVVSAINEKDWANLSEELGDLMLQSVFHAAIAEKNDEFDIYDVLTGLSKKLLTRHPHVFGEKKAGDKSAALAQWEEAKKKEKAIRSLSADLAALPVLPETMRAVKVGGKAQKAGIGFGVDPELCLESAYENMKALVSLRGTPDAEAALGELMYAVCTAARLSSLDPELCLRRITDRNIERIRRVEAALGESGKSVYTASASEIDDALARAVFME